MNRKKYKSDAFEAIHESATSLHKIGVIGKETMREFDCSCLTQVHSFSPTQIRKLRERENVSQTIFANYLNISKDSVSKWERGEKKPAGPSLKLLSIVEKRGLFAIS